MKIFSTEQFYKADAVTIEKQGVSSTDLMERAGIQIFNWLHRQMQGAEVPIHIFCGIGNNGGDGLALGRILIEHKYNVFVYIANFTDKRSPDFLINYDRIKNVTKKWPLLMTCEDDFPEIHPDHIIIDGLFGIGLNRPIEGWVKKLVHFINEQKAFTLSIDIPSGLYSDRAPEDKETIIKANNTLSFQAPKLSFFLPETGKFVPYFELIDLGLDPEYLYTTKPLAQTIGKVEAAQLYKRRDRFAHKGNFGHSLIIGGSYGKIGAAILASHGAYRAGGCLVSSFVPKCGYNALQAAVPEVMVICDVSEKLITSVEIDFEPSAIGVGVGMGTEKESVDALSQLFSEAKVPLVIDADALNCISENKNLLKTLPKGSILTPHPGELRGLIGTWKDDFDKIEKAKKFAKKHEIILLIKGAFSMIVFGDDLYINRSGNNGMATGGSGDVLTGMVTGLISQGYEPLFATIFGVYLHGSAGDLAAATRGLEALMASDILDHVGMAYKELFRKEQVPNPEEEVQE